MKNHVNTMIFHTAICFGAKQIAFMAEEKSPTRIFFASSQQSCSRNENSVKNHVNTMIFHTAVCFGAKQIAFMAEEKSPTRISIRLFATKLLKK